MKPLPSIVSIYIPHDLMAAEKQHRSAEALLWLVGTVTNNSNGTTVIIRGVSNRKESDCTVGRVLGSTIEPIDSTLPCFVEFNDRQHLVSLWIGGEDVVGCNCVTIYCITYHRKVQYVASTEEEPMSNVLALLNQVGVDGDNSQTTSVGESSIFDRSMFIRQFKHRASSIYSLNTVLDILLGLILLFLVSSLTTQQIDTMKTKLRSIFEHTFLYIFQHFMWLIRDSTPAGFKLNQQLNILFGRMALGGIYWWRSLFDISHNLFSIDEDTTSLFLYVFKTLFIACSIMGLSFVLSLLADIFAVATSNILLFYRIVRKVYTILIHITLSLWRVFRGKKDNPLRNRIDNCDDYSYDQLILGTILFTICIFLYSTVAVYYFTFVLLYVVVVFVGKVFHISVSSINYLPINHFLNLNGCRNKGVHFSTNSFDKNTNTTYMTMHANKMSLSQILFKFRQSIHSKSLVKSEDPESNANIIKRLFLGYPLF